MSEINILFILFLATYLIPLGLLFWTFFSKTKTFFEWPATALLTAVSIYIVFHSPWKSWVGAIWPWIYLILFLGVLIAGAYKRRDPFIFWEKKHLISNFFSLFFYAVSFLLFFEMEMQTSSKMSYPQAEAHKLELPLGSGHFMAVQRPTIPLELKNEMKFAVSFVELNSLQIRAWGLMPRDLHKYEIFGREVLAPCPGIIISARDDLEDLPAFSPQAPLQLGNQLAIQCHDYTVVLSNLKTSSLKVSVGDVVETGQALGQVGHSGLGFEPQLLIHAYKGPSAQRRSIPLLFNNIFYYPGLPIKKLANPRKNQIWK